MVAFLVWDQAVAGSSPVASTMEIILVLGVLLAISMVIGTRQDIPDSLSMMVYDKPPGQRTPWMTWFIFTGTTLGLGLCIVLPDPLVFLGIGTILCVVWTGLTPIYTKLPGPGHVIGGIGSGIFSQVAVVVLCPWVILVWTGLISALMLSALYRKRPWIAKVNEYLESKFVLLSELMCLGTVVYTLITSNS